MADTQFHGLGTENAPADWTIPGSLDLVLKAARAVYDGTSALSDFYPCLEVISDSGNVVGKYVAGSTVTAGDQADVSFGPFLEEAVKGGGGSGITEVDAANSSIHVLNPTGPTVSLFVTTPVVEDQEQLAGTASTPGSSGADLSWAYSTGSALFDLTAPTTPKIVTAGVYTITVWVNSNGALIPIGGLVEVSGGINGFPVGGYLSRATTNTLVDTITLTCMISFAAGDKVEITIGNQTATALTFQGNMLAQRIA